MVKFCTVATHAERYFPCLLDSCRRHGCDLTVLGWGQKWQGPMWKFQLMRQFVRQQPRHEIIVFVDAFDVVVLRDAAEVERIFRRKRTPLLISAEKDFPNALMRWAYRRVFPCRCQGVNLNSGAYMGYCWALQQLFEHMWQTLTQAACDDPRSDDQRLLAEYCHLCPDAVAMDADSDLFMNIHGGSRFSPSYEHFDIDDNQYFRFDAQGKVRNVDTGRRPCVLHAPGNANMDAVVDRLGLRAPLPPPQGLLHENSYWWRNTKHFAQFFAREAVVLTGILLLALVVAGVVTRRRRRLTNPDGQTSSHTSTCDSAKNRQQIVDDPPAVSEWTTEV